ncbi:MAG TPA: HAD family hydrolase [Trebonia sp.]|nr:HAD family hydrolase [Trebonia sp.]
MTADLKAVLFDVDGTLVDTNYLHTVAWWEAFAQAGHDVPMASVHRSVGMGSDRMLDALLPGARDTSADDAIRAAHSALYSVYWSRLRPLPGAARLLRACHDHGLRVVLASSAGPDELKALRGVLDADDAIDAATSAGDVDTSKPAPDLVQLALEQAGARPDESVFIGDAVWDVRACRRAGVACIAVLTGGTSRDELTGEGAAAVFDGPADLLTDFPRRLLSEEPASARGRPNGAA